MSNSPITPDRTDSVTLAVKICSQPTRYETVGLGQYLQLRQMEAGSWFGWLRVTVLCQDSAERSTSTPRVHPHGYSPNAPIALDQVRAGAAFDARWSRVDPRRWVIDSVEAQR